MKSWGGKYSDWYVRITSDVKQGFFINHKVTNKTGWIWDECENSAEAEEIKDYFIKLGAASDSNSRCIKLKFVYIYKKSINTIE